LNPATIRLPRSSASVVVARLRRTPAAHPIAALLWGISMAMRPLFPDLHHLHSGVIPRMTRMPSRIPPRRDRSRRVCPPTFLCTSVPAHIRKARESRYSGCASGSGDGGTNGERNRAEANYRR
jgi:hypothetical protein